MKWKTLNAQNFTYVTDISQRPWWIELFRSNSGLTEFTLIY